MAFTDVLNEEFSELIKIEETQVQSKFMGTVREETADASEIYHFLRTPQFTAQVGKVRHAELDPIAQDYVDIPVTMKYIAAPLMVDDFDGARSKVNFKMNLIKQIKIALGQAIDDEVVSILNTAATGSQIGTSLTAAANNAGWSAVDAYFTGADVNRDNLYAMIRPGAKVDVLGDTNLVNAFHFQTTVQNTGDLPAIFGFKPVISTRLPVVAGPGRRNFFYRKDCVGIAKLNDIRIKVSEVPMRDSMLVLGKIYMSAAVIDPKGVRYADIAD